MHSSERIFKCTTPGLFPALLAILSIGSLLSGCGGQIRSISPVALSVRARAPLSLNLSTTSVSIAVNAPYDSSDATVVTGAISSCAVSPSLPVGLVLTPTTCRISGIPTSVSGTTTYSILVTGSTNVVNIPLDVEVYDVVPAITFSSAYYGFNLNVAGTTGVPTNVWGCDYFLCHRSSSSQRSDL